MKLPGRNWQHLEYQEIELSVFSEKKTTALLFAVFTFHFSVHKYFIRFLHIFQYFLALLE